MLNRDSTFAVLLTSHNRKHLTITCLDYLFKNTLNSNYSLDVFLVDDGSTDGTSTAVKNKYPEVTIIKGSGNLFWNQGMRLAWNTAVKTKEYDFYIWLNDDTLLFEDSIVELFSTYTEAMQQFKTQVVVTGACQLSNKIAEFSYGGRTENGPLIPNGTIQTCKYINGNIVLVPRGVYKQLGNLSNNYTHAMGDFDYGLRAIEAGYTCCTTKKYIAVCELNKGVPGWCDPQNSLNIRWKLLHSPKGLNIKEYILFRKRFSGFKWVVYALKAYMKTISPTFYKNLSK